MRRADQAWSSRSRSISTIISSEATDVLLAIEVAQLADQLLERGSADRRRQRAAAADRRRGRDRPAHLDARRGPLPRQLSRHASPSTGRPSRSAGCRHRACPICRRSSSPISGRAAIARRTGSRRSSRRPSARSSGGAKIEAMADWIRREMDYVIGSSDASTTAVDAFLSRRGVCRDFAHLMASFARAAGIPARLVSAYAWGLKPPDFHAVVEVWLDGGWHLVDADRPRADRRPGPHLRRPRRHRHRLHDHLRRRRDARAERPGHAPGRLARALSGGAGGLGDFGPA